MGLPVDEQALTRISRVGITELDKALRIFCEVLEVTLLDPSGVQPGLPSTVKGDLLVSMS
jgi:hypothetical protein